MNLCKMFRCCVRNRLIVMTPEEKIRQQLLRKMMDELGFPKGLISVEKKIGKRRYDIVSFTQEMKPLLLIECKAGAIDEMALNQAIGYNDRLKAPFICLVNQTEIQTFWQEKMERKSVPFLPLFQELCQKQERLEVRYSHPNSS